MAGWCVPHGGTCPEPTDDAGTTGDGTIDAFVSPDAETDAFGSTTCSPMITGNAAVYHTGSDFSMSRLRTRAALRTFDSTASQYVVSIADGANVDTNGAGFVETIRPGSLIATISKPRLAPDGNMVIATATNVSGDVFLAYATKIASGWSSLTPLRIENPMGFPISASQMLVAGTPSESSPRHMPVWLGGASLIDVEEVGAGTWRQRLTINSIGGFAYAGDPSYTPDGLRITFVGQISGGALGIYTASRPLITAPFNTASRLFDDGTSVEASPFLVADCGSLFYDNLNGPVVLKTQ